MTGDSIADAAPPMAHAIGGSLGGALALLLLYPLERARVELQTMSASTGTANNRRNSNDINDKVMPVPKGGATSSGGTLTKSGVELQNHNDEFHPASTMSPSEGSWQSCLSMEEGITSSSEEDEVDANNIPVAAITSLSSKKKKSTDNKKLGVLACIYQLHQRKELYRGVTPVVTTLALSNFVFFYFHSFLRGYLSKHTTTKQSTNTLRLSLLASSLAGIANVLLTNPLWVANLRIVTSGNDSSTINNNNLWTEMISIIKSEGWAHLWNGTPASLLLVSNPVIQFVAYEQLKNRLLRKTAALKPLEAFVLGALAKAISTVLTYPLQLAQTVLRVQKQNNNSQRQCRDQLQPQDTIETTSTTNSDKYDGSSSTPTTRIPPQTPNTPSSYRGTLDCLIQIYRRKGLEGWFAGMRTKLLQTVLTAAFTFLTYEQIIRAIMAVLRALQENRRIRNAAHTANVAMKT